MPELAGEVGAGFHYSGGSSVIGPDGSVICALPAYLRPGADGRNATQAGHAGDGFDAAATEATRAALARGGDGGPGAPFALGFDESVIVVRFDADEPRFRADAARNPYLRERRSDLYGGLV